MERGSNWWLQRKLLGWALVDYALIKATGLRLLDCQIVKNPHGKPEIMNYRDLHYNLSHTGLYFIVGISRYPIGVDIETDRKISSKLAKKVFTEKENQSLPDQENSQYVSSFLRIWTQKESYTKALGIGYQGQWDSIETSDSIAPWRWKTITHRDFICSACYQQTDVLEIHPLITLKDLILFYQD